MTSTLLEDLTRMHERAAVTCFQCCSVSALHLFSLFIASLFSFSFWDFCHSFYQCISVFIQHKWSSFISLYKPFNIEKKIYPLVQYFHKVLLT